MKDAREIINERLIETFNALTRMEETAWAGTRLSDISMTEVHTLEAICSSESPAMGTVATRLSIAMATLTSAIDKLEKKGYCARERSLEDRRIVRLSLTKKGLMAVRLHRLFHHKMVAATVEGLTSDEEQVLASALAHLNGFINETFSTLRK